MSGLFKTYKNLSPNAKLGVGVGLLVWGFVGLHLSDKVEAKLGYTATDADKAELEKMLPRVSSVPRGGSSSAGGGEKA